MPVERIVSLLPSSTEIVCALGFENSLVGRSHECDFPESVQSLPICTRPKFNPTGNSYEIHQNVQGVLRQALSVYEVHADILKSLRPDLIVTQSQCEVCAVSLREVERVVSGWLDSPARIVSLEPDTLVDVWEDIRRVADALDVSERGVELVGDLKGRADEIVEITRGLRERATVGCVEWIDPLMTGGNWIPELVEMAGGLNVLGRQGEPAARIAWAELLHVDPDVLVIMPCGFEIRRARDELAVLERSSGWTDLRAVRTQQVYLVDGNHYFNRPGPRLIESLEILAEILHPKVFQFGQRAKGWEHV